MEVRSVVCRLMSLFYRLLYGCSVEIGTSLSLVAVHCDEVSPEAGAATTHSESLSFHRRIAVSLAR